MIRGLRNVLVLGKYGRIPQNIFGRTVTSLDDTIVPSPYQKVSVPDQTLDQYVWENVGKWSTKTAMVDGVDGRKFTYAQLRDYSRALAVRLQKTFDLKKGDVIAICVLNSIEFPIISLGAIEASLTVTPINPVYTADEISRQLLNSDTKVLFGQAYNHKVLEEAVKLTKKNIKIVYSKLVQTEPIPTNGIIFNELIETVGLNLSDLIVHDVDPKKDVPILPYSSGTTGMPKGVRLSHYNLVANCQMANCVFESGSIYSETADDFQESIPCVLPYSHIYGLTVSLLSKLQVGCKMVALPFFRPDTFLNALSEHKATVLLIVPPIANFLANYKLEKKHTEHLKLAICGASPITQAEAEQYVKNIPNCTFSQGYGLTEASPVAFMCYDRSRTSFETIGRPLPLMAAKVTAVNDTSYRGLGPNISGEILVRGPNVMQGYHNNEEATKETLVDGWLKTGDIGYYDKDHYFFITDRLKELIKVKGFQVPPAELENILKNHPKILDAGVVGVLDKKSGELPRAFVVLKPNQEITEDEIKEFVAKQVADYKRLDGGVQFIESIPKNATGKIMRRILKEKYSKKSV